MGGRDPRSANGRRESGSAIPARPGAEGRRAGCRLAGRASLRSDEAPRAGASDGLEDAARSGRFAGRRCAVRPLRSGNGRRGSESMRSRPVLTGPPSPRWVPADAEWKAGRSGRWASSPRGSGLPVAERGWLLVSTFSGRGRRDPGRGAERRSDGGRSDRNVRLTSENVRPPTVSNRPLATGVTVCGGPSAGRGVEGGAMGAAGCGRPGCVEDAAGPLVELGPTEGRAPRGTTGFSGRRADQAPGRSTIGLRGGATAAAWLFRGWAAGRLGVRSGRDLPSPGGNVDWSAPALRRSEVRRARPCRGVGRPLAARGADGATRSTEVGATCSASRSRWTASEIWLISPAVRSR